MRANHDAGLTRAEAAKALGVEPQTVSMWALRGWVEPDGTVRHLTVVGRDRRGARRYRYGDLLDAEAATADSPNSRRGVIRGPSRWAALNINSSGMPTAC